MLDLTLAGFPSAGFSPLLLKYTNVQNLREKKIRAVGNQTDRKEENGKKGTSQLLNFHIPSNVQLNIDVH